MGCTLDRQHKLYASMAAAPAPRLGSMYQQLGAVESCTFTQEIMYILLLQQMSSLPSCACLLLHRRW